MLPWRGMRFRNWLGRSGDFAERYHSRAKEHRLATHQGNHRRFDAYIGRPAVENHFQFRSERFADVVGRGGGKLGEAMGTPAAAIRARATGCDGIRMPTVAKPAVTSSGICGIFRSTRVSGPGQYLRASSSARGGHSVTSALAISIEETWTINGLVKGRPFIWKMRCTAPVSRAFAPKP